MMIIYNKFKIIDFIFAVKSNIVLIYLNIKYYFILYQNNCDYVNNNINE